MSNGNETALRQCRFLGEEYFQKLYEAFTEAFSDYVIPFALTETQFRNHINATGVDLTKTVGCFDGGRLIGFSLNGFGLWAGAQTVYDAGTGVIPAFRREGVSQAMFEMMLPVFRGSGVRQFLLEVVTTNTAAISLYKKFDFFPLRELGMLQSDSKLNLRAAGSQNIEVREIEVPDWDELTTFWDGMPSWQNSVDAVNRGLKLKRILGAYLDDKCVGYVVYSAKFGRIGQFAVAKQHRRIGIGSALLRAVEAEKADGFSMQVINIDKSLNSALTFFRNRGFYERLAQHEMVKQI